MRPEDLDESERQRAEIWTRVMGYHRPVSAFNPGKQSEVRERKLFLESPLLSAPDQRCGAPARNWLRIGGPLRGNAFEALVPRVSFCDPEAQGGRLGDHPTNPGA